MYDTFRDDQEGLKVFNSVQYITYLAFLSNIPFLLVTAKYHLYHHYLFHFFQFSLVSNQVLFHHMHLSFQFLFLLHQCCQSVFLLLKLLCSAYLLNLYPTLPIFYPLTFIHAQTTTFHCYHQLHYIHSHLFNHHSFIFQFHLSTLNLFLHLPYFTYHVLLYLLHLSSCLFASVTLVSNFKNVSGSPFSASFLSIAVTEKQRKMV